jgi:Cof subfamily protein (haloacid dehalogenase superfamily)
MTYQIGEPHMKKISDYMLISDVDGTLVDEGVVPERNAEAIKRFVGKGGRFGIATGRSRGTMREAVNGIPLSAPCVLYNGGALYDYNADEILWELFLPETAIGFLREIYEEIDYTGVMIVKGDMYYRIRTMPEFDGYFEARHKESFAFARLDELPRPWYKAIFQVNENDLPRFLAEARAKNYPGVKFLASYKTLGEMLPEASSKGAALAKLVELGHVRRENLVAIGDYYNDLDMIEYAGTGVAVADAPDDIKARADMIVGPCKSGAVADVIEYIESLCDC